MSDEKMREALAKYMETRWGKTSNVFFLASLESAYADAWQASRNAQSEAKPVKRDYRYARDLAVSLAQQFYPDAPQWKPFDDLYGVLTQIDNMTTGLCRAVRAQSSAEPVLSDDVIAQAMASSQRVFVGDDEASDAIEYMGGLLRVAIQDAPATPAPVKPAESGEDAQLDRMTTLRFRRLCNAVGYPDPTDGAETMSVEWLFSSFGAMASMLERIAPIGAGDAERLDFMIESEAIVTTSEGRFHVEWPGLYCEQGAWFDTAREAIDAARQDAAGSKGKK